jgi:adenylylsulfate kinase
MVVWLTGQPGSGKTTLSKHMLLNMGSDVFHIDGDDLRDLFNNKDYSETGRRRNVELAQQIAEYLTNKNKHVIVSLVSPYKDQRDKFKEKMGQKLVEVYVHTTEERGREDFFVEGYEPPTENFLDMDTTKRPIYVCSRLILEYAKSTR